MFAGLTLLLIRSSGRVTRFTFWFSINYDGGTTAAEILKTMRNMLARKGDIYEPRIFACSALKNSKWKYIP